MAGGTRRSRVLTRSTRSWDTPPRKRMVKAAMPSVTLITARAEALPLRSLTISIASATATPPRRPGVAENG